jgi:ABC-type transporter MlaC component
MLVSPMAPGQTSCDGLLAKPRDRIVDIVAARYDELAENLEEIDRLIDELVQPYFDFDYGSEQILIGYWENASAEEQRHFKEAFYEYLVAGFGPLLIYFKPDTLDLDRACSRHVLLGEELYVQDGVLTLNDGTQVSLNFIMHSSADGVRIFDIRADGNSQLVHFRSQFADDLRRDGLGALITWLEKEAALLREQRGQ